jgi:hypothetical protein
MVAHGRWFSPGTPASSTTQTGRHDVAEILLKVALNDFTMTLVIEVHLDPVNVKRIFLRFNYATCY